MAIPRIFVSYARADGESTARQLAARLTTEHGLPVWRDLSSLEGGSDWWRQITEAIDAVEYVVLVLTPHAVGSATVREEWRYARQRGACVIPVLGSNIDTAALPGWMRRTHIVDPTDSDQWTRLIRTLEGSCRQVRVPMMAEPPPTDFVSRPDQFNQLRDLLVSEAVGGAVAISAALKGAGGYGKTTLAKALCHDALVRETFDDGVIWITLGENPPDPSGVLEDLIVTLTGAASGFASLASRKARLTELLRDRHVLAVIDDVWTAADLDPFLVGGGHCARLITTRNSSTLPENTREVRVDAMNQGEASAMLTAGLPGAPPDAVLALAGRLGEWPLLLKLVNGVLRDRVGRSLEPCARAFEYVNRLLDKNGLVAFDAREPSQRYQAVSITIEASLARLSEAERDRFAELAVFQEDAPVPLGAVIRLWTLTGGLDEVDAERLLQTLFSLSLLLDLNLGDRFLRLHDVIRSYARARHTPSADVTLHSQLVEAYRRACSSGWASGPGDGYFHRYLLWHLTAAGARSEVHALLLDPDWLEAKLQATDIADLVDDYRRFAVERDARLTGEAVSLSANALVHDASAVLPQLLGRLEGLLPAQRTAEWRSRSRSRAWLCPMKASLTRPGGPLVQTLTREQFRSGAAGINLRLSDSGDIVAVESGGRVELINLARRQSLAAFEADAAALTPDGQVVVTGFYGQLTVRDIASNVIIFSTACPNWPIVEVAVTPDREWVAAIAGHWMTSPSGNTWRPGAVGADSIHVWETATGIEAFTRAPGHILRFLLTADGRHVVLSRPAGVLEVWRVETGECVARWESQETDVRAILETETGEVAVASAGGTVQLWSLDRDWPETTISGREVTATCVAPSRTAGVVLLGFAGGTLEYWRREGNGQRMTDLRAAWDYAIAYTEISALAVTPDGRMAVSIGRDGNLHVWDFSRVVEGAASNAGTEHLVDMSPDGRFLILNSDRGTVLRDLRSHLDTPLAHDPDATPGRRWSTPADIWSASWIAVQEFDGAMRVWKIADGQIVAALPDTRPSLCALISHHQRIVSISVRSQALCIDDVLSGEHLEYPGFGERTIDSITAIEGTDQFLVVSRQEASVHDIHNPLVALHRLSLQEPREGSGLARASVEGRRLLLREYDYVEVWNLETGARLKHYKGAVAAAVLSRDGQWLIVGDDRMVKVLDLASSAQASFYSDTLIAAVGCADTGIVFAASVDGTIHELELRRN